MTIINLIRDQMSTIQFIQMSPEELVNLITESVKIQFNELSFQSTCNVSNEQKEFITRKETAQLFKVSLVTIHDWINNGIIKPYKLGNRTYFKYSELLENLYDSNRIE